MSHPVLLYAAAFAAFALVSGWLLWRAWRPPQPRPGAWPKGYDLSQLGQESYQPVQRFDGLTAHSTPLQGSDKSAFLEELRGRYVALRQALDTGAWDAVSEQLAPELMARLQRTASAAPSRTEVITLQALLLEFDEGGDAQRATVEFSGLVRDHGWGGVQPLRELWRLERAAPDAAWRLVSIQSVG